MALILNFRSFDRVMWPRLKTDRKGDLERIIFKFGWAKCKCMHFYMKFGAVFEAGLIAAMAIHSFFSFLSLILGHVVFTAETPETS